MHQKFSLTTINLQPVTPDADTLTSFPATEHSTGGNCSPHRQSRSQHDWNHRSASPSTSPVTTKPTVCRRLTLLGLGLKLGLGLGLELELGLGLKLRLGLGLELGLGLGLELELGLGLKLRLGLGLELGLGLGLVTYCCCYLYGLCPHCGPVRAFLVARLLLSYGLRQRVHDALLWLDSFYYLVLCLGVLGTIISCLLYTRAGNYTLSSVSSPRV